MEKYKNAKENVRIFFEPYFSPSGLREIKFD